MVMLNKDVSNVEPAKAFEPLPPGPYVAKIVGSEIKPTKNLGGEYLELKVKIIDGPHVNRTIIDRLNLVNQSAKAVEIAEATLSSICEAIGHSGRVNDSQELHDKPLKITVAVDGAYNAIKGYAKIDNFSEALPGAGEPAAAGSTASAGSDNFLPPGLRQS